MTKDPVHEVFGRRRPPPVLIEAMGRLRRVDASSHAMHVLPLLNHPEPDVRSAAISTVFVLWRMTEQRHVAVQLLQRDRHDEVRSASAFAIAAISSDATRRDDVRLLLAIVDNEAESIELRRSAYEGLLLLFQRPDFPNALGAFDPVHDVDWQWVKELRALFS